MELFDVFSRENIKTFGLVPHPQQPERINPINPDEKNKLADSEQKTVLIIGAGLAGLSAALELAERGFAVTIYEKNKVVGGKLATPVLKTKQGSFHVEHGLHMWFYHYHTCKDIIRRLKVDRYFKPYRKVSVYFKTYNPEILRSEPPIYPFNLVNILNRSPNLGLFDMKYLLNAIPDLMYFQYDGIFDRLDNISYHQWAKNKGISEKIFAILFEPAASVTINDPETISAAELVMWTHYFFISHPKAMWREIAIDHHAKTLLDPWLERLQQFEVDVKLDREVNGLHFENNRAVGLLSDEDTSYDWVILASDVKASKAILNQSKGLDEGSSKIVNVIHDKLNELKIAPSYRIMRAWFDRPTKPNRPDIMETPQFRPLHLIAQFHLLEEESRLWAKKTGGSVIEFHFYADETIASLPSDQVWEHVQPIVFEVLPELSEATLLDFTLGTYANFTSFDVGQGLKRPTGTFPIDTGCKNLLFAGDWVHTHFPSALMERAAVTGRIAANHILHKEHIKQVPITKCSNRGPGLF
ncbi:MAG: FAD-dependent oxidoreductase [Candidatus Thermoplasmatota archaeon]|nr:FAD-dependent oxidoreductase [Candidatus Thermoplasmatota archaeon]